MKSSLIRSEVVEEPGLPERLTAATVVKFTRGLFRKAKKGLGGTPHLFSMTIETDGWSASARKGTPLSYYAGGAASVRGSLAIMETNLSAIVTRQGPMVDPRIVEALALIRSVLTQRPRTTDGGAR